MSNKCFCHLTVKGEAYEVKDANARERLDEVEKQVADIETLKANDEVFSDRFESQDERISALEQGGGSSESEKKYIHIFKCATKSSNDSLSFEIIIESDSTELIGETSVQKINNAFNNNYKMSISGFIITNPSLTICQIFNIKNLKNSPYTSSIRVIGDNYYWSVGDNCKVTATYNQEKDITLSDSDIISFCLEG